MWASMFVSDSLFATGVQTVLSRVMPEAQVLRGLPSEPESAGVDLLIVETSARHSIEVGRAWNEAHPNRPMVMFTPTGGFDPIAPVTCPPPAVPT